MEERNMPKADFVTAMIFVAFGIGVLVLALQMPRFEGQDVNPYSVPGIVPGFLGAIIAFLGGVMLIRSILKKGYRLGIDRDAVTRFYRAEATKRFAMTIVICVVYALVVLGRVPYEVATALFVFAFIAYFEYESDKPLRAQLRKIGIALLMAVLVAGIVGYVFRSLFLVNLPGGGLSLLHPALPMMPGTEGMIHV
ncbi:MAG: tripartite tricarboxylate transporter TctB family protein [Spirochaetia bacterium]